METLTDLGIPASAVLDSCEVLEDPHLKAREMIVDVHVPARGDYQIIGCPIKVEGNDVKVRMPPLLGQHSEEVLAELLGMSHEEIESGRDAGVV